MTPVTNTSLTTCSGSSSVGALPSSAPVRSVTLKSWKLQGDDAMNHAAPLSAAAAADIDHSVGVSLVLNERIDAQTKVECKLLTHIIHTTVRTFVTFSSKTRRKRQIFKIECLVPA